MITLYVVVGVLGLIYYLGGDHLSKIRRNIAMMRAAVEKTYGGNKDTGGTTERLSKLSFITEKMIERLDMSYTLINVQHLGLALLCVGICLLFPEPRNEVCGFLQIYLLHAVIPAMLVYGYLGPYEKLRRSAMLCRSFYKVFGLSVLWLDKASRSEEPVSDSERLYIDKTIDKANMACCDLARRLGFSEDIAELVKIKYK